MKQIQPQIIFNKKVFPFSSESELVDFIKEKKGLLIAVGTEKLLNQEPRLTEIINSNYAYSDGIAAVYALHHRGHSTAVKIPGAQLWLKLIESFPASTKYYLLGAQDEILSKTIEKLKQQFNINIVGYHNGYYTPEVFASIKREIVSSAPDVVFVAMGSPKQEYIMDELSHEHQALYMGLGGSFDLYTGFAKPVPDWWKKIFKWEGIYRQFNDPFNFKRWKRQLHAFHLIYCLILDKY